MRRTAALRGVSVSEFFLPELAKIQRLQREHDEREALVAALLRRPINGTAAAITVLLAKRKHKATFLHAVTRWYWQRQLWREELVRLLARKGAA